MSYVGPASDEYRAVCVYSDVPGDPQCDRPAVRHVRVVCDEYGEVMLASCSVHLSNARTAGRFVQEHDFEGVCGFPSTLWVTELNICVLDASGEEPAREEQAVGVIAAASPS